MSVPIYIGFLAVLIAVVIAIIFLVLTYLKNIGVQHMGKVILMLAIIYFMFITFLALAADTYGFEVMETVEAGKHYYIYTLKYNEQPFNETLGIVTFIVPPTIINNSYFDNETNMTIVNITEVYNPRELEFDCGEYIACPLLAVFNDSYTLVVNITLDDLAVDIYESYVTVLEDDTVINETFFKFFIGYDDVFEDSGSYIMQPTDNFYNRWIYEGDLPQTFSELHTVLTRPNETLYLDCTGMLTCSENTISTNNITIFTSTMIIPLDTLIGTHYSYIYLNTSYNTSGNITFKLEVLETQVIIEEINVSIDTNVENMTSEELQDFLKQLNDVTEQRISELQAANRTKEKIVEINKTVPFVANIDQIILRVAEFYNKKDNDAYTELITIVDKLTTEQNKLKTELDITKTELTNTKNNAVDEETVVNAALNDYDTAVQKENFIFRKGATIKFTIIIILFIISPIILFILYKKSWGGF